MTMRSVHGWRSETSIIGRVVEKIQIPVQDRSAFEAAYPELLGAFVSENFEALSFDSMPSVFV